MRLAHLSLTNFRNFIRLDTDIPAGPVLVVGANAQGKTSLLEAIYYLAGASSPHTATDRQLINFLALREPAPFARLIGEIVRGGRPHRIEIRLVLEPPAPAEEPRLQKEILLNGIRRRSRDLGSGLNAVLFLPQDLRVIEGSPGDRRRYLDATVCQADLHYAEALAEYARILAQRNALLKQLQERGNGAPANHASPQLAFWDERLAETGALLIRGRSLALSELDRLASPLHAQLTNDLERLRLDYQPAFDPLPRPAGQLGLPLAAPLDRTGIAEADVRDGLRRALEETRAEEIARGVTLLGPHRDDFRVWSNGVDLGTYGSRGQNRTAMLSLKLAEVEWMHARSGEWPALLLDEVLAELDIPRRQALLQRLSGAEQAILTCADVDMFTGTFRQQSTIWHVEAGSLRRK